MSHLNKKKFYLALFRMHIAFELFDLKKLIFHHIKDKE